MYYIGVDLGGTNIAVGLVDESGKIIAENSTPTLWRRGYAAMIRDMADCANKLLSENEIALYDVKAVGIGIPGIGDNKTGRVIYCPNIDWHDVPLREEMQKYLNLPVMMDNDATVAGLAENFAGISAGCESSVFLTLGTGVGGGIILGGKPWSGKHNVGSEIGHMIIEIDGDTCNCGKQGCLERYTSATAIDRMARQLAQGHKDSALYQACGGDLNRINAKMVFDMAKDGDTIAMRVFRRYVKYLSIVISNVIMMLDPEMIVLGGGVSKCGDFLLNAVREEVPKYILYKDVPYSRIELARLGNDAGIIGAAMLGKNI
ncbi:MAG: ROK family protein [Eubacteriales bacterium]|nr:ROK family protein [Eubacteriales bacterium]MDD3882353.1 ROK family protein [Eubacteriales bacterium]MDD4512426.1 ROK family protein [Eubacteriales bacterium]